MFSTLCCSPFGSHAVEKMLTRLNGFVDALSQEEYEQFEAVSKLLMSHDFHFALCSLARLICARADCIPPVVHLRGVSVASSCLLPSCSPVLPSRAS